MPRQSTTPDYAHLHGVTDHERFMARVRCADGHWIWRDWDGSAATQFRFHDGRRLSPRRAARVLFLADPGSIDIAVVGACDEVACVRPSHTVLRDQTPPPPERIAEVVRLFRLGRTIQQISRRLKLHPTTIGKWLQRAMPAAERRGLGETHRIEACRRSRWA